MSATPIPFPQDKNGAHVPFEAPSGPWWKYAHMWMVVGGPLIVVVASFVTLWMAIRTPDPVYTDADVGRVPSAATATLQPADEMGSAAMAPAMQARNHAATGGMGRAPESPASSAQP